MLALVPEIVTMVPMAFNLKDERAVAGLRELARLEGTSMSAAAAEAIEEKLERARRPGAAARMLELAAEIRSQPGFTPQSNEESDAEMYDELGLPK